MSCTVAAPQIDMRLARVADGCALVVMALGLAMATGWLIKVGALPRIPPGSAALEGRIALGFILAGAGIWWRGRLSVRITAGSLVAVLGAVTLGEYFTGQDFGVGQWFLRETPRGPEMARAPGGMSLLGVNLTVGGIALLALGAKTGRARHLVQAFATTMAMISGVALIAHGIPARNPAFVQVSMPVLTAGTFLILAAGLLCVAGGGFAAVLASPGIAGRLSRPLLPGLIGVSLLLGWLELAGERAGLFEVNIGITLFAAAETLIFIGLVWWTAVRIERESAVVRDSETRYHRMFDMAAVGLGEGDARTGRILWVNQKFCEITGYSAEELLGKTFLELTHPEDRQRDWNTYQQTLREPGRSYRLEKRYVRKDGSVVWVRVNVAAFDRDRDGRPRRSVASVEDITEYKQAEEERQKFVSLADNSTEFIGMCDLSLMPFYINEAAIRLVGMDSRQEALRTHVQEFFFPEDRPFLFDEFFPRILREGRGRVEIRFRHFKTGAPLWVTYNVFYVKDTNGHPIGLATVSHDITARRTAEEALRRSEADLRLALDAGQLGEWKWDIVTGEIAWSVRCKALYGLPPDAEITYELFLSCVHPDDRERVSAALQRAVETLSDYEVETRVFWPDGTVHWNSSWGRVFCDAAGRPISMTGVSMDITERKRMDEALRVSEERLNLAVRVTRLGIFEHDHRTDLIYVSARMREMWGWSEELPVTVAKFLENVSPDDRERIAEAIRRSHDPEGNGSFDVEFRVLRPDGIAWLICRAQTFFEGEGSARRPVRTVGAALDITGRKRAEEALRVSEERLKQAVRVTRLGIFEHDHRTDIIYWSPLMRDIWGWGENVPATVAAFVETVHPDDREAVAAAIRRAYDPIGDGLFDAEYRAIRRDGSIRWVIARGRSFFEGEGSARRLVRTVGAALDITERKQVEEALRESEELWRAVFENNPTMYFMVDAAGTIVSVNPWGAKQLGYTTDELIGRPVLDIFYEEDRNAVRESAAICIQQLGQSLSWEFRKVRKDGTMLWVRETARAMLIKGRPVVLIVCEDITDRKHAEKELARLHVELEQRVTQRTSELEAANRELEAFSYSVSHDLRAPLRAIAGFTAIFVEDFGSQLPEDARQVVGRIQENAKMMGMLIDDLLHFSRTTRQPLSVRRVDLAALTRDCYQELDPQREGREIEFTVAAMPPCEADPILLRQAMLNLLSNAVKYSRGRTPARIEVGATKLAGEVVYFVRDNGAGFDMQYADKLFGVFQRLHTSNEYEGTGVGLAIVQRIVHRHGGRVWAEAEVGKGATFYFTLRQAMEEGDTGRIRDKRPTRT